MKIIFIRHGKTKGNIERRYIGKTDENLSKEGIFEIKSKKYPNADIVISSPMKRCIETAELIYGRIDFICDELKECNFGDFENKNYDELKNDENYIKWLESNGKMDFPNGEGHKMFCERCCNSFYSIIKKIRKSDLDTAFIVHGGTIMAIFQRFSKQKMSFYDMQIKNSEFIEIDYNDFDF